MGANLAMLTTWHGPLLRHPRDKPGDDGEGDHFQHSAACGPRDKPGDDGEGDHFQHSAACGPRDKPGDDGEGAVPRGLAACSAPLGSNPAITIK
jgi:hypothetical protein